jgi:hypothetical protein
MKDAELIMPAKEWHIIMARAAPTLGTAARAGEDITPA